MSDRELLELAAKAAGMTVLQWVSLYGPSDDEGFLCEHPTGGDFVWNPLTDDGDRYRLIAKLKMSIDFADCTVWTRTASGRLFQEYWGGDCGDEAHAVLRVAASLPPQQTA